MEFKRSTRKFKKYMTRRKGTNKWVHFGDSRYPQYRDTTGLGLYSHLDHGDKNRRRNYFMRHSGVPYKLAAIDKEMRKGFKVLTPKILSHKYLW